MAKKFDWSKEVEDTLRKANFSDEKIAELKEKKSRVEKLSLEDLDGTSGGGGFGWGNETPPEDWPNPVFNGMTLAEGRALINALYDAFGEDVTIAFCMEAFDFKTNAWEESLRAGGPNYCADVMWGICWKYGGQKSKTAEKNIKETGYSS